MKKALSLFISTLALLSGCQKENPTDDTVPADLLIERKDLVLTRAEQDFIKENNGFALELFKKVSAKAEGKSTLISPLSVTIDFGMVNNGATGETQDEINRILGYAEGTDEGLNAFCRSMLVQSAEVDPSTTIDIANAAVVNKLFIPLKDSFTDTIESVYDAEVVYKDFAKDDVIGLINRWCSEKTQGMIPTMLETPPMSSEYAHFLNAVYFKGIWSNQFKKRDTNTASFFRDDGGRTPVRMMRQRGKFNFGYIYNTCTALCLPYGNQAYRMIILLPDEGKSIEDVKTSLSAKTWDAMVKGMVGCEVDVKLPLFETETELLSLKEALIEMGIRRAFSSLADFSGMTDQKNIYVNQVWHKAKIKVDETGSEAAAVTDIAFLFSSAPNATHDAPPVIEFHCDKPFLYAITEVSSGAIFFLGQYTGK